MVGGPGDYEQGPEKCVGQKPNRICLRGGVKTGVGGEGTTGWAVRNSMAQKISHERDTYKDYEGSVKSISSKS
jgi:hypothetical protein